MTNAAERSSQVVSIESARATRPAGTLIGTLVAYACDGPLVDYDGNTHGPLLAQSTVDAAELRKAVSANVVIALDRDKPTLPIILGIIKPVEAAPSAEVVSTDAVVDGKRVTIRGAEEITFECGASSIVLRANGRIVIRGAYVETRASGQNRIRGGSVKIN